MRVQQLAWTFCSDACEVVHTQLISGIGLTLKVQLSWPVGAWTLACVPCWSEPEQANLWWAIPAQQLYSGFHEPPWVFSKAGCNWTGVDEHANFDLQAVVPALSDWMAALRGADMEAEPARPNYDPTMLIPGLSRLRLSAVLDTITHTIAVHLCSQEEWHNFMQHSSDDFLSYLSTSMQVAARKLFNPVFQEEEHAPMAVHAGFITLSRASRSCSPSCLHHSPKCCRIAWCGYDACLVDCLEIHVVRRNCIKWVEGNNTN